MLYNKDFNEVELEEKANLIIIDIPYNIGRDAYASNPQWWKNGNVKDGYSEKAESMFFDSDINFNIDNMLLYCQKNLKENEKVVIFCSYEQQFEIINKMKKYGFKKYTPLVFIKNNSAEALKVNIRIVGACEYGLVLYNGKLGNFYNNGKMIKNYFEMERLTKKLHPNQKPIRLLEQFINLYTKEDDLVLDFVMGSGSTGVACKNLHRRFIGIEKDKEYYNIAKERILGDKQ